MLGAIVVPVMRGAADRAPLRSAARRFGIGTVIAMTVLVASGVALAAHYHRWGDTTLQVKLGLVALVALLIAAHLRWPEQHALDGAIFLVSLAIVWLGVAISN